MLLFARLFRGMFTIFTPACKVRLFLLARGPYYCLLYNILVDLSYKCYQFATFESEISSIAQ